MRKSMRLEGLRYAELQGSAIFSVLRNVVENKKITLRTPRNTMKMHIRFGSMIVTDSGVQLK
mgnify:CR=1 FL=1